MAAEIGDVVAGETDGLRPRTTVFDSTGLAIQDIATARRLYETAVEDGEAITERWDAVDTVRFTNSGTESTSDRLIATGGLAILPRRLLLL